MTVLEQQGEQEKATAEEVIAENPPFEGIENIEVTLGEDYERNPALWLVFKTRQNFAADETWIKAFTSYYTNLGLKILDSGVTRFPYHRLEFAS